MVREFGLFGEFSFKEGALLRCGCAGLVLGAVSGGGAGGQFERSEFAVDDGLAFEGVVLVGGEQLPAERGEFARGGDDRDLGAAPSACALVERAQRAGGLDR